MSKDKTVVVSGYGAWASAVPNPAARVLQELGALDWDSCQFIPIEIPVRTRTVLSLVEDALLTYCPTVWLGLGVAPGAATVRGEMVGINCRDFDVPDIDGQTCKGVPVVEEADAAHFTTLPVREIITAIAASGIPATVSYSAGTHLCNQMLYTLGHLVEQHRLKTRFGFVHVPYTPDLAAKLLESEGQQPSLALSDMTKAARIAVEYALRQDEE